VIAPVGTGRPPSQTRGAESKLYPRERVLAALAKPRAAREKAEPQTKAAPEPRKSAPQDRAADPAEYREILATLRGLHREASDRAEVARTIYDQAERELQAATERYHEAERELRGAQDAFQANLDALEAVEKVAGVR